ncbi:MAG: SPOR domain-containing protein [Sphingomonas sp.]|uniref:SPOR domain-containing protein n=1 Tax=Sphingomonas sp. TaxID=28214 RepID=UPI002272BD5B|nr:SPOR domain-containing protein [Sphingomonas sp.]MCX8478049.1 SPOR domain-containing protein [Sphingomonas sp.]
MRVVLLSLPALGLLPILDMAQASRQTGGPTPEAPRARPGQIDRPATITLGALIEVQRREREQRRAIAAAELLVEETPSGESWQAQLGAFRSADAAERQRARLMEAANLPVVVRQAGALHRLESLPALRADTETLCARAQASGMDCFVRRAADAI